jgi:feruloyl esterase
MLFGEAPGRSALAGPVEGFLRHLAGLDLADLSAFDLDRDAPVVLRRLSTVLDARSADLRPFIARGGRLILWHGWNDAIVPPGLAVDYHAELVRVLGAEVAASSVRLFMAPGVEHGAGGPGTDRFGQHAGGDGDPERSLGAALQRWVEQGVAPERVVASRLRSPRDPASEVERTRLLCAWPRVAAYQGGGSTDDARHFQCVEAGTAQR